MRRLTSQEWCLLSGGLSLGIKWLINMAISSKKALDAAKVIVDFCKEQRGCQNCIFRLYGADNWKCHMYACDMQDVLSNIEAKKKNHGYI